MSKLGRSWTNGSNFRPARDVEIKYGKDLIKNESKNWPSYVVVTTKTSGKDFNQFTSSIPRGIGIVNMLDWDHLEEVSNALPDDADLVIGLGGGTALDASKYVALRKNLPLRLIPSIVSTGAIIHGVFAKWKGRKIIAGEGAYCDFEHVLVDYDLVSKSPWYLNTAGIGDVLCMWSDFSEWKFLSDHSDFPTVDEQLISPAIKYLESLVSNFPATLGRNGEFTNETIKFIMNSIHERDDRMVKSKYMTGAGHYMTLAIEGILDRGGLIHGELAALGAVIVEFACGSDTKNIENMLTTCKVRYKPGDIGITTEEFLKVLDNLYDFYSKNNISVLSHVDLNKEQRSALCKILDVKI
tara:strand:- start:4513 stop:5574 length:1062 start_codon:yes stop_codon:yes gene_type:complete